MTSGWDLWNIIAIVIGLNLLYEDFDKTTTSLLGIGNKIINQIQSILQSKEAKNLSKYAIRDTGNLAMAFKDKSPKKKANSNDKYYNYHKFGYFGRNYFLPDRRLNRNT